MSTGDEYSNRDDKKREFKKKIRLRQKEARKKFLERPEIKAKIEKNNADLKEKRKNAYLRFKTKLMNEKEEKKRHIQLEKHLNSTAKDEALLKLICAASNMNQNSPKEQSQLAECERKIPKLKLIIGGKKN
jgi:hypothetical protein